MVKFNRGKGMRLLKLFKVHAPVSGRTYFMEIVNLLISFAPSLVVGFHSLFRPATVMGSDQDLMWASEALRLLRGLGPSYADHPGALWSVLYAINIKALEFISGQVLENEFITPKGLIILIQAARIESSLIAGFLGYICWKILVNLQVRAPEASAINITVSCSSPLLYAASAIRHELLSTLLMLSACLMLQQRCMHNSEAQAFRVPLGIFNVFLIFAAAFGKQQSLILLPFICWISIITLYLNNPARLQRLSSLWHRLNWQEWIKLCLIWGIAWLLSAVPDIDLINLPVWATINLILTGVIIISLPLDRFIPGEIMNAAVILTVFEVLVTRVVSANWWRQAVTGFPSWLMMFGSNPQDIAQNPFHFLIALTQYSDAIFETPILATTALASIALSTILRQLSYRMKAEATMKSDDSYASNLLSLGWLSSFFVLGVCLLRINPPYTIYFFPCLLILSSLSVFNSKLGKAWRRSRIDFIIRVGSLILLSTGILRSVSNLKQLHEFGAAGLPETAICIGHNMDIGMKLTPVGKCPDFNQESRAKKTFDHWWLGPN